ncbi:MAG: MBL fold metallo-hydrolase [Actinobacteria bacterium]|nr:MBL fold metallo-hydrolase [Actinomycetota bacterium]
MKQLSHVFTFLGTGAGCGVPAFFCDCPACQEAKVEPRARRGCCGVLIEGSQKTLIDTPPDIRHQFLREGIDSIDNLIYTHAHFDHIGGLGELEYLVRLKMKEQLPTYSSQDTIHQLGIEFGYMQDCLYMQAWEPFAELELDDVRYTALPATHQAGTFGYLIETPETRLFYACDTGKLLPEVAEKIQGVDILILDATFWGTNWSPSAHHSIPQTIETGLEIGAKKIYLTHLAMHYAEPITLAELEEYIEPYDGRVVVPYDGLKIRI